MESLITTAILIIGGILVYRFGAPVIEALRRFNAHNVARIEEEVDDRRDARAHYRHTLRLAQEQVEEVNEIPVRDPGSGAVILRYVFEGEQFATRDEAEAARQQSIVAKARQFYQDLPAALAHRRKETLH